MKTARGKIKIWMVRYARPDARAALEVTAYIIGEIAIHRRQFWGSGDAPEADTSARNSWTVSHIPSGSSLARALPPRLVKTPKKAELEQWALLFQTKCPEFFEMCRDVKHGEVLKHNEANQAIASHALTISKGL